MPTYRDLRVPFEQVAVDPKQARKAFRNIKSLADSIGAEGLLQAILVKEVHDYGQREVKFLIIAGERRYRAIEMLRERDKRLWRHLPIRVRSAEAPHRDMIAQLAENSSRDDLRPWEYGSHFAELRMLGHTDAEIAKDIGKGRTWVGKCRRLCDVMDGGGHYVSPAAIELLGKSRELRTNVLAFSLIGMLQDNGEPDHDAQLRAVESKMLSEKDRTLGPDPLAAKRRRRTLSPVFKRRQEARRHLAKWGDQIWTSSELSRLIDYVSGKADTLGDLKP